MEVSITDLSEVEKEIQIQSSADELRPHFDEAYKRYQTKIEIKGFRKGKAPLDMVKRLYGESIEYDSLNTIASDIYRQVVKEKRIFPIGEPLLSDIDYKRGEMLMFKIKYEIKPNIELKEYKKITAEKIIHKVTDQEIDGEIIRLQKSNSILELADTVLDDEYLVTADIQHLDDSGSPLIGKHTPDARFYLANETLIPEIKTVLKDVKVGDHRKVKYQHKHDDHSHNEFVELSVKKIEKVVLPIFDDAFVKKITKDKFTNISDFKEQIRKDIEKYWIDQSDRNLLDSIIGEIVRRHEFKVPESLVKGIVDSLIEDFKNQFPNKKLPADFEEAKFRESNRSYGVFQAKWYLIQERIIDAEKITVEDADLEKLAEDEATKYGIDKERLIQFYKSSDSVKDRLMHNKLTDLLKKYAVITEKVVEESTN